MSKMNILKNFAANMYYLNEVRGVMLHICVICSMAEVIIHILDWYNPFMDFMGHSMWLQYILYIAVFVLAVLSNLPRHRKRKYAVKRKAEI